MIWGVNFGLNNITNAVSEAIAIRKAFLPGGPAFDAGITLDAIEMGNEADLYATNGLRAAGWNISTYTQQCVFFLSLSFASSFLSSRLFSFEGVLSFWLVMRRF